MPPTAMKRHLVKSALIAGAAFVALAACGTGSKDRADEALGTKVAVPAPVKPVRKTDHGLPGMPPVLDPKDVYAADRPNKLSPVVKDFPSRVYVPNTESDTVSVIDPKSYEIIETIRVGRQPQHVVPSWDLKTLWVNNDRGNTLTPIDPRTGKAGEPVDVHDPYNLYFTPNGKYAVVMASSTASLSSATRTPWNGSRPCRSAATASITRTSPWTGGTSSCPASSVVSC